MEKGAEKILAKHGCLYMKDDYKALFEELEAYYKPTEVVKNNAVLPHVSGSASDRYRKALGYISEMTFEIEIGTEKGSDVLEKALRIASGYNVD